MRKRRVSQVRWATFLGDATYEHEKWLQNHEIRGAGFYRRQCHDAGCVAGVLFEIGRFLLGLYLGRSSVASPYGSAGSLVTILLWVYHATLIFFGAELTQTWAAFHGRRLQAQEYAQETPEGREKRRRQMQEVGR